MLFFIEHGPRRVHLAGITPTRRGVVPQLARQLVNLGERADALKFVVRDRNAKFTAAFETQDLGQWRSALKHPETIT